MMKSIYWRLAPKFKRALLKGLKQSFLLNRLNLTATISINGVPFRIPVTKGVGYQNVFMTEMWMVEAIKRLLPLKPGAFVDIGANIGQTLLKLRAVSRDTPYLGLEPNPACASYVCEIIRANRFDHTTLVPVGISDARAILELDFFAEGNQTDSGASLVKDPEFRPGHPVVFRQPVPVFPYEDVSTFLRGAPPCLVKIDVEGAEFQVLDSMQETIRAHRPLILLEILPMSSAPATLAKNTRVESLFDNLDYGISRIEKMGDRFVGFSRLDAIGNNADPAGWDYLACPNELQATVAAAARRTDLNP